MQKFKDPAALCGLAGLFLGLGCGCVRAGMLPAETAGDWLIWLVPAGLVLLLAFMTKTGPAPAERPAGARLAILLTALVPLALAARAWMTRLPGDKLWILGFLFPLMAGLGMALSAGGMQSEMGDLGAVAPVFYQGYLLLQLYRANATDTHRADYVLELLCLMAVLLALYGAASRRFMAWGRFRSAAFAGLGLYGAGLLGAQLLLAPEHTASLPWLPASLVLTQAAFALYAAASALWPAEPIPEEDEEEEDESVILPPEEEHPAEEEEDHHEEEHPQ